MALPVVELLADLRPQGVVRVTGLRPWNGKPSPGLCLFNVMEVARPVSNTTASAVACTVILSLVFAPLGYAFCIAVTIHNVDNLDSNNNALLTIELLPSPAGLAGLNESAYSTWELRSYIRKQPPSICDRGYPSIVSLTPAARAGLMFRYWRGAV